MGRKNAISPQFEDEEIQRRLWDTFQQECLWEGVTKLDYLPLLRPHESRRTLQKKLVELVRTQERLNQWKYLWETPGKCQVCHMETDSMQPIQKCTLCYKQVHHVCLANDEQAASTPVCRACASDPDPDRTEMEPLETPVPPDEGPRQEELEGPPLEIPSLDATGVVPCPTHGMDHLTRDPSCEFCKKALGPLYRHLKGKYGSRLEDQTPTLSFDFSEPFPISATGSRFMLLFVWRLSDIRLFVGVCSGQTYKGKCAFLSSRCCSRAHTNDWRFEATCDAGTFRSGWRISVPSGDGVVEATQYKTNVYVRV